MRKENIRTSFDALLYFTDCTLATVDKMAITKSRNQGEYKRQKSIAQHMCDVLKEFNVSGDGTRVVDVIKAGNVEAYATEMEKTFNTYKEKK